MPRCRVARSIHAELLGNSSPGESHVTPMLPTTVPISFEAPCCPKALEHPLPAKLQAFWLPKHVFPKKVHTKSDLLAAPPDPSLFYQGGCKEPYASRQASKQASTHRSNQSSQPASRQTGRQKGKQASKQASNWSKKPFY